MESFRAAYGVIILSLMAFLLLTTVAALFAARGAGLNLNLVIGIGLGLLFFVLGNYMGKVRKNFFVGIRTPWTLASDEVWYRTHRLGGWLFAAAGVITIVATLMGLPLLVMVASIALAGLVPVVYSFLIYRRLEGFD